MLVQEEKRWRKPVVWSAFIALLHAVYFLTAMGARETVSGAPVVTPRFFVVMLAVFASSFVLLLMGRSRYMNRRAFGWVLLGAAAIGATVGGLMVSMAIDHNPQGAFIDLETGAVDYLYLSLLFYSWFLPFFLGIAIPVLLCFLAWGRDLAKQVGALGTPGK